MIIQAPLHPGICASHAAPSQAEPPVGPPRAMPACSWLGGPRAAPRALLSHRGHGESPAGTLATSPRHGTAGAPGLQREHPVPGVTAAATRCHADYLGCLQSPSAQSDALRQHPPFVHPQPHTEPPRWQHRSPHPAPPGEGLEPQGCDTPALGVPLPGPRKQPKAVFAPSSASGSHQLAACCGTTAEIPSLPRNQTTSCERALGLFSYQTESRATPATPGERTDLRSLRTTDTAPSPPQPDSAMPIRHYGPKRCLGELHPNPRFPSVAAAKLSLSPGVRQHPRGPPTLQTRDGSAVSSRLPSV